MKLGLRCNCPAPSGARGPFCGGETVYEVREACAVGDGRTAFLIFRYCLSHLRSKIAVGMIDGDSG